MVVKVQGFRSAEFLSLVVKVFFTLVVKVQTRRNVSGIYVLRVFGLGSERSGGLCPESLCPKGFVLGSKGSGVCVLTVLSSAVKVQGFVSSRFCPWQ